MSAEKEDLAVDQSGQIYFGEDPPEQDRERLRDALEDPAREEETVKRIKELVAKIPHGRETVMGDAFLDALKGKK